MSEQQSEKKGRADSVDKLVSRRLKMRRMILGLSQNDLGKAVDVSIQQVQKYEKATNRISSGKLFAFAKFLKVPISYFYDQNEDSSSAIGSALAEDQEAYGESESEVVSEKEIVNLISRSVKIA